MKHIFQLVVIDQSTLRNVDTIQKLTDILVSNSADLVDASSILRNSLQRVTRDDQLILLGGRLLHGDTIKDLDVSDLLLTQEVSDLDVLLTVNLNGVNVDREMGVDVSHLVLVTLGNTGHQVRNQRLDSSQSSDVLSVTVKNDDLDSPVRHLLESDIDVLQVLGQLTSWTSNLDGSGLDVDSNTLRDLQDLLRLNELHAILLICE